MDLFSDNHYLTPTAKHFSACMVVWDGGGWCVCVCVCVRSIKDVVKGEGGDG